MKDAVVYSSGLGAITAIGCISPSPAFMSMVTTFGLAGIVGKMFDFTVCIIQQEHTATYDSVLLQKKKVKVRYLGKKYPQLSKRGKIKYICCLFCELTLA